MEEINQLKQEFMLTGYSIEEVESVRNGEKKMIKIATLELQTPNGKRTHTVDVTNVPQEDLDNIM